MGHGRERRADPRENIVLTGFMGAGKSAVGRELARKLKWEFVDTDGLITRRAGRSIPAIFEKEGEAVFRTLEREAIATLAGRTGLVIATGGGALADPANLAALRALGPIVLLRARPETLLRRIGGGEERPLLAGASGPKARLDRIRALLEQRYSAYAQSDLAVDTDRRSVKAVAEAVLVELDLVSPRPSGQHAGGGRR